MIAEIDVAVNKTVPVAPDPPPPLNVMRGVVVNPLPPAITLTDATPTGARTACPVPHWLC